MRLINADDLIITVLTHELCDTEQIDKDILEAPTVEAIPIEWIKKEIGCSIGAVRDEDYDYTYASCILQLLERWEKENANIYSR